MSASSHLKRVVEQQLSASFFLDQIFSTMTVHSTYLRHSLLFQESKRCQRSK